MRQPRLKLLLIGAMASLGLVIAAQSAISITNVASVHDDTVEIATNWLPAIETSAPLVLGAYRYRVAIAQLVSSKTLQEASATERQIQAIVEKASRHQSAYEENISEPEERALFP